MTGGYNGVIQRKLALLDSQVGNIESHLRGIDLEVFSGDWAIRSMTERAIQVAVEIVIDVAERIIALENAGPVATAADSIRSLVRLGVLASERPFVSMIGLRNIIVHEYAEIDPTILYSAATSGLADFRAFRDAIDSAASGEA